MQLVSNIINSIYSNYQHFISPLNNNNLLFYCIYFFIFFLLYLLHTTKTSINIFNDYIEKYKDFLEIIKK